MQAYIKTTAPFSKCRHLVMNQNEAQMVLKVFPALLETRDLTKEDMVIRYQHIQKQLENKNGELYYLIMPHQLTEPQTINLLLKLRCLVGEVVRKGGTLEFLQGPPPDWYLEQEPFNS